MKDTTIDLTKKAKKAYSKPSLNRVRLVAEEAVLAVCKNGNPTICEAISITCINIAGS